MNKMHFTKCTLYCTYLSDKLPRIGVRKNPTRGDKHQIKVMYLCATPTFMYSEECAKQSTIFQ